MVTLGARIFKKVVLYVALVMLLPCTSPLRAQSSSNIVTVPTPVYDIVSIKPNKTGSGRISISRDDLKFDAENVTLYGMLIMAYDTKEDLVFDAPKWAGSSHFDVTARVVDGDPKIVEKLTKQQYREMLQPILTERFKLKSHTEVKTLPVYELVVAKGGSKLVPTPADDPSKKDQPQSADPMGRGRMRVRDRQMTAVAIPMASLATQLSSQLHRTVIDKTGLAGDFDFSLSWAPEDPGLAQADANAPSIFTAIQEQLGLKLVSSKGPVETLVIDQVELPEAN